jgi:bacterioferritin-associated ferredoxin
MMNHGRNTDTCSTECRLRYVCHCLQVTDAVLREAFASRDIRTLKDLRRHTGAGDGCMACHARLTGYLRQNAPAPELAQIVA